MARRRMMTAVSASMMLALTGATVLAQDQPAGPEEIAPGPRDALVRSGDCIAPGDEVALLVGLPSEGPADGAGSDAALLGFEPAQTVMGSITEVPLSLETLADGHAVWVEESTSGALIACGPIGGSLIDDDGLAIALMGPDGDRLQGMAWLQRLGLEQTIVHVFVAGQAAASPTVDPDPSPMPDPSSEPDPSSRPSPDPDDPDDPVGPDPDVDIDPADDIDVDVGPDDA